MNISAKELAKLINVSPATVSMVFNNKPGISDATRELVLKTAAEYGYAPKKTEASGASSRIYSAGQLIKSNGKVAADTSVFLPADRRNLHRMHPPGLCASYLLFL